MRLDTGKYQEVLDLMKDFKDNKIDGDADIVQCYHAPQNAYSQFWGRDPALQAVQSALKPHEKRTELRTFALYGMGGVGKTQIALQYAEQNRELYDSVLWIAAGTTIGMGQSTRDILQALGLIKDDEELRNTFGSMLKLKNWLRESCRYLAMSSFISVMSQSTLLSSTCENKLLKAADGHWLLVLDNADDPELLNQVWPKRRLWIDPHHFTQLQYCQPPGRWRLSCATIRSAYWITDVVADFDSRCDQYGKSSQCNGYSGDAWWFTSWTQPDRKFHFSEENVYT